MKKSLVIFFSFILMSSFFISGIYAQDTNTNVAENNLPVEVPEDTPASDVGYVSPEGEEEVALETTEDDKVNILVQEAETFKEELSVGAGITPDSGLYFVEDKILAPFRDDSVNRERKIAEMQKLAPECGQGNQKACEGMRESLGRYQTYSNNFKRDVSPEQRDEALRSSERIRGTFVRDIAQNLPPTEKDGAIREIMLGEIEIKTAAEIAGKIKELCQQLSKLDPNEYSRVCSSERDAPDWRKKLDDDLTEEQRKEALKFGEIMSQCFKTAGQNCRCEDISFPDFAGACSIAAPLAEACDGGDEKACETLDSLEMPIDSLPDYLQKIFGEIEGNINKDKYGMFLPPECEEAGATNPKDCAKIMINTHAPEECKPALLAANVQSEREGREICEKIMFNLNAPSECIDAGISDPRLCGNFMFEQNAPQECIDAGITGESKNAPRECQQLMESQFRGPEGFGPQCAPGTICAPGSQWAPGTGPDRRMSGGNCAGISDSEERLKCYDGAGQFVQEFHDDFRGKFEETQNQQRKCAEDCRSKNSAWDFSGGICNCKAPNFQEFEQEHRDNFRQDFNQQYNQQYGDFKQGQYYPPQQPGQFQPPQGMTPPQDYQQYNQPYPPQEGQFQPPQDYSQYNQQQPYQQPPTTSGAEPYSMGGSAEPTTTQTTTSSEPTQSSSEPAPTTSSEPTPSEPSPVTGGVISNNKFLRFWFWG